MSVVVATTLDAWLMEPPLRAHPVVGFGRYLGIAERRVPSSPPGRPRRTAVGRFGARVGVVALALRSHVVRRGDRGRDRAGGRPGLRARALSRIVSRDTEGLSDEEIRGAAVESLAENLSDSLVAPLFWYLVAGLPGAAVYRFANTADASWGYLSPRWRYAGRPAARVDDALNLVPARLTAALLLGAGDWSGLRTEARRPASLGQPDRSRSRARCGGRRPSRLGSAASRRARRHR